MSYTVETASSKEKTEPDSNSENSETTVTKATTITTSKPAVTPPGTSGAAVAVTVAPTGELFPQPTANGNVDFLQCSISPQRGSILDTFNITCKTRVPCSKCQYCFTTTEGKFRNPDMIILHENLSNLTKKIVSIIHIYMFKNFQGSICVAVTTVQ